MKCSRVFSVVSRPVSQACRSPESLNAPGVAVNVAAPLATATFAGSILSGLSSSGL
jgi:hypothetical protein